MMEHIGQIIARIEPDLARGQAKQFRHNDHCPFWDRIDPLACTCETRPLIDLLLLIADRGTA